MYINIDYTKCNEADCLECLDLYPMQVFDVKGNVLIISKLDNCCGCQACVDVCSTSSVSLIY